MSITDAILLASSQDPFSADTLLTALGPLTIYPGGPTLNQEFEQDVGVWERYTLAVHTRFVLRQFETYFPNASLPLGIRRSTMRIALALHDAGKPEAIRCGSKRLQHEKTMVFLNHVAPSLPLDAAELQWMRALIDGDPLGGLFRNRTTLEATVLSIRSSAKDAALPLSTYLPLLLIYYQCDASAYTSDPGGLPSLEKLFLPLTPQGFPRTADGRRLQFAPDLEDRLNELLAALAQ